jgi:hypothetical protein
MVWNGGAMSVRRRDSAAAPERRAFVQGYMIGLVALDRVLRLVPAGVMDVAFVGDVFRVHPHDPAADAAGFRIPADVIADLEAARRSLVRAAALFRA